MNAGTILYIPVAQAEGGATVTVKGQLYGPTLKLDGTDITTGTAVTIATDSTRYVPLSVEGTGSLYLTGIAIDYAAGSPAATSHTVTVGTDAGGNGVDVGVLGPDCHLGAGTGLTADAYSRICASVIG